MNTILNKSFLLILFILVQSCATYDKVETKYKTTEEELKFTNSNETNIYLIGDAGYVDESNSSKALIALEKNIQNADENDVLLFLGDNIYPKGFDKNNENKSIEAIDAQIKVAKKFKGKVIFIPGNHDWYSGIEGLKNQEKFIENTFGKNSFLPQDGCSIDSYEVSDNIVIISIDSEWYLTNWDKHPKINDNCEIDTREKFWIELKSVVNKNQNKTIIIAVHHPLESNGNHGGQFEFSLLKAPMNILRRASGVSPADTNFPLYRELSNRLSTILQEYKKNVIVVSGHEHNLQFLEHQNIPQIISGSGSKIKPVRHYFKKEKSFEYAGLGFAVLSITKNQQMVHFYNENNYKMKSILIRENKNKKVSDIDFPSENSKTTSIYKNNNHSNSKFYTSFIGKHYRTYYYKDYSFPVVNLDTLFGGLKPVKLGGGNQSVSLRLEDKNGKEYVMRRMSKSASQFIQINLFPEEYLKPNLENTISEKFLKDFYTTAYPFAPIIVSKLSENVGVYYAKPKIYYVPKQNALQQFSDELGDDLFLIEERMTKESKANHFFGNSDDIISTDEVIENISKDEKYKINTNQYIKTRLFDMWLGDWDRHGDQFRWATYKVNENEVIYEPIPRDRDQAFSNFDGIFTRTVTALIPALRKFQTFENNISNIKTFNSNAIFNDLLLTNQTTLEQWINQAEELENKINNDTINKIFENLPYEISDMTTNEIKVKLINRKKHIKEWANDFYNFLNKNVIITGTNKKDFFEINRKENGFTEIKISRIKSSKITNDIVYEKTFDPKITKEIWLYGLNDDDLFNVKGNYKSTIKILLIGGQNKDSYSIDNNYNIKVYDYKTKECNFEGIPVSKKLSDDYDLNHYDFKKRKHNIRQIFPAIGFNPDEGFIAGAKFHFTKFSYELNPFSQKHSLGAKYFSATSGYELTYSGEIANVISNFNFKLESRYTTPAFAQNFFGIGNETNNLENELEMEYYRTRLEQFNTKIAFVKKGKLGSELHFQIPFDFIRPNENENRFVEDNLNENQLERKYFIGFETGYFYENKNNKSFSTLGIQFQIKGGFKTNLKEEKRNFTYLKTQFQLDYPILKNDKLTLATIWNFDFVNNSNFEFYQAATIGGKNGVRGFRNERFSGQYGYYQNTDIRLNLLDFNAGILPAKLGVYSGFDYGRVWNNDENSNKWHNSFGGGMYVNTSGIFTLQTSYFYSNEGGRFVFGLGFGF